MQFIRLFSCLMALIFSCSTFANESTSFLMGQIEGEEGLETAFILQLHGADLENRVKITGDGEVYIKVDKISILSEAAFIRTQLANCKGYTSEQYHIELCSQDIANADYQKSWRCSNCQVMNDATRRFCWLCFRQKVIR